MISNGIMRIIKKVFSKINELWVKRSPESYIAYLRKKGISIGENVILRPRQCEIDLTRPSLVSIGNNVYMNKNFTLLTHDFVSGVFINLYDDFLLSSGQVTIGNNVRFGINCTVLKDVTIGDNCFIGACSLVTKDIPPNSIAAGVPAKVICSISEYYERRKEECIKEALLYAKSINNRYNREPRPEDFWEEFPLFVDINNIDNFPEIPIKKQLGKSYINWLSNHKALYKSFEEFIKASKNL